MILFQCDYNEGAHPKILERLMETNLEQTVGYGEDPYCAAAAEKIRMACGEEDLAVHFLVGGTQTNMTVIDAALRSHQGVLCAVSGHINVHETMKQDAYVCHITNGKYGEGVYDMPGFPFISISLWEIQVKTIDEVNFIMVCNAEANKDPERYTVRPNWL